MGKIIQFQLPTCSLYNAPPAEVIGALFSLIRGLGTDMYLIRSYGLNGINTEITRGRVSNKPVQSFTTTENMACVIAKHTLESKLDQFAQSIPNDENEPIHYAADEQGFTAVAVKSDRGVIAFGWQDGTYKTSPHKGKLMVTLLAYAFGYANSESCDEAMVRHLFHYLPFSGHFGGYVPADIDLVICSHMKDNSPLRGPSPTSFRRPVAAH